MSRKRLVCCRGIILCIAMVLDILGIRSRYHYAVFSNGITSKIDQQYETTVSQVLMLYSSVHVCHNV